MYCMCVSPVLRCVGMPHACSDCGELQQLLNKHYRTKNHLEFCHNIFIISKRVMGSAVHAMQRGGSLSMQQAHVVPMGIG